MKKSSLNLSLVPFSKIGRHISSVAPGKTVDSKTMCEPTLIYLETVFDAPIKKLKSGLLFLSIGVGTVMINCFASTSSSWLFVNTILLREANEDLDTSFVLSKLFLSSSILFQSKSKPITSYFFENPTANGNPTYPNPIIAILPTIFFIK